MKLCSVLCVVGFGALMCFGFLALTGLGSESGAYVAINAALAFAGGVVGVFAWLRIRACPWQVKGPGAVH